MQYKPEVVEKGAERLYQRAHTAILAWIVLLIVVGGCGGLLLGASGVMATLVDASGLPLPRTASSSMLFFGFLGGLIGLLIGLERSFMIRFRAQSILLQVQIEKNTRKSLPEL